MDNIYVSLSDASQTGAFKQALDKIAQRHKLSVVEITSPGVVRFDYVFDSVRTHAIHVVTPLTVRTRARVKQGREKCAAGDHH